MSMTSKVINLLRLAILNALANGSSASNQSLRSVVGSVYSLRSIQEATQKMTKEGLLVASTRGVYKLNTNVPQAIGATA
jgi:hypothetical protein